MTIFTWGRWSQPDGESVEDLKIVSYLMLPWGGVDKRERLALEINFNFISVLEVIHFFSDLREFTPTHLFLSSQSRVLTQTQDLLLPSDEHSITLREGKSLLGR